MRNLMRTMAAMLLALMLSAASQAAQLRELTPFDTDWKFFLGDPADAASASFDDSQWETVKLPHDFSIGQDFDQAVGPAHGFIPAGTGWYRKTFNIPMSEKGRRISVIFDGVSLSSDVYVNGHHLGTHPYPFTAFEYDLTPWLNFGASNVIAVRAEHDIARSTRWYSGSGIYRHVRLLKTSDVRVAIWGTYVTTPSVSEDSAEVSIAVTVENRTDKPSRVRLSHVILSPDGKEAARVRSDFVLIEPNSTKDVSLKAVIQDPVLWDLDNPAMYSVLTTLSAAGRQTDTCSTDFGIRTVKIDTEKGMFLNGEPVKLQGVCLHHDAGSLGTAVPDRSYERRLEILKEFGVNAVRCSHNQPSSEFLDMCDRIGLLVIDEAFDKWKSGYYSAVFDEWWSRDLGNMIMRDRNHPSIIMWSIGNEVAESFMKDDTGVRRAEMLQDFVHALEPTRPVTVVAQPGFEKKFSTVPDVMGFNYMEERMVRDHAENPSLVPFLAEAMPYYRGDISNLRSYIPDNPWNIVSENDFILGEFIWSGPDYLGESSGWPSKGWPTGVFDICMFEKPAAAYFRSVWNPKPMVKVMVLDRALDIDPGKDMWQNPPLADHWNFPQYADGRILEVRTVTNCERVTLVANGKEIGTRRTADYPNNSIIWEMPYKEGSVEAIAYNGDAEVARDIIVTAGRVAGVRLTSDRTELRADGTDLSHIVIELVDADGNRVQTADAEVSVSIIGGGRLIALDNGDLRREGHFAGNAEISTYFGRALAVVEAPDSPSDITVRVYADGINGVWEQRLSAR